MGLTGKIAYFAKHPVKGLRRICRFVKYKPRFREYHWSDVVTDSRFITPEYVRLGVNVIIGHCARIQGIARYNNKTFTPEIRLGNGVSIQQNLHLTCASGVTVGENTAIAANVTITDVNHPYQDISLPVEAQDIKVSAVTIGADCKIYNGAVILPGTSLGRHCVVGANSVVSGTYPDYCVIAGAPARVIKQYDPTKKAWVKPGDLTKDKNN